LAREIGASHVQPLQPTLLVAVTGRLLVHIGQCDSCTVQEILRKHNEPKRAATSEIVPPASLWHAMQQRERPSSSSSDEAEQGTPAAPSAWLEDGTGGLFDSGHAPARAASWQLTQAQSRAIHVPTEERRRQIVVLEAPDDEEDASSSEDGRATGAAAEEAAGKRRRSPGLVPEGSEPSSSMISNLMSTMRR